MKAHAATYIKRININLFYSQHFIKVDLNIPLSIEE